MKKVKHRRLKKWSFSMRPFRFISDDWWGTYKNFELKFGPEFTFCTPIGKNFVLLWENVSMQQTSGMNSLKHQYIFFHFVECACMQQHRLEQTHTIGQWFPNFSVWWPHIKIGLLIVTHLFIGCPRKDWQLQNFASHSFLGLALPSLPNWKTNSRVSRKIQ